LQAHAGEAVQDTTFAVEMMPSMTLLCITLAMICQILPSQSAGLRGQVPLTVEDVEKSLLAELAGSFRNQAAYDRISKLEVALAPLYKVVPQEPDGRLSHAVVRYTLHRFFVQRNGWFIRGLEPGTSSINTANISTLEMPRTLLEGEEWVPAYLQSFLEQLQGGKGISLKELAIIAGTLEDLIHKEAVYRLHQGFHALELPVGTPLHEATVRELLEVYMMIYMVGGNVTFRGRAQVLKAHNAFVKKVKDWGPVQEWMHKIQMELFPSSDRTQLTFNDTERLVEEVGRRYGSYNDNECASLKSELLSVESKKAGRVRLAEFYKKGLTGVFEFNEKIEYLRTLGVLDESDPTEPHVIVPNYVGSRPNCLVASNFYVVCCRNECEDIMGPLEQKIGSEFAKPEQIADIIPTMSSSTVAAPRKLSDTMLQRLQSVAQINEGVVPLHGRLFAQWMHHAFPRECPFPHVGPTNPQTPDEWMQETGQADAKISKQEAEAKINQDTKREEPVGIEAREHHQFAENELPWDDSESLLRPHHPVFAEQRDDVQHRGFVGILLWFAAPSSLASVLVYFASQHLKNKGRNDKAGLPMHCGGFSKVE
jgi:hypothetical protein